MKIFLKMLFELFTKEIELVEARLLLVNDTKLKWSEKEQWYLDTGKKFCDLISKYPISENALLEMDKILCDFVMLTRITDIEEYFFVDKDREYPRLPYMLKEIYENREY